MTFSRHQTTLARNAAVLLLLGLLTGIGVGLAMTGAISVAPRAALASHLNALLGCFWMIAVAWTLPMLRYEDRGKTWLVWLVTIPNFANWILTFVKGILNVAGLEHTGHGANDAVFGLLTVAVVLPSFAAAGAWVYGFGGRSKDA